MLYLYRKMKGGKEEGRGRGGGRVRSKGEERERGKVVKLCKCPDIDNDIDYNALSLARYFHGWYVKNPMMNPNVV